MAIHPDEPGGFKKPATTKVPAVKGKQNTTAAKAKAKTNKPNVQANPRAKAKKANA